MSRRRRQVETEIPRFRELFPMKALASNYPETGKVRLNLSPASPDDLALLVELDLFLQDWNEVHESPRSMDDMALAWAGFHTWLRRRESGPKYGFEAFVELVRQELS